MMAFKMARVFSGKEKIVKFAGAFHGWSDPAYVTDPKTDRQYGIPSGTSDSIINAPPHDLDAMDEIAFVDGKSPQQIGSFVRAPRHMPLTFTPTS